MEKRKANLIIRKRKWKTSYERPTIEIARRCLFNYAERKVVALLSDMLDYYDKNKGFTLKQVATIKDIQEKIKRGEKTRIWL